MSDTPRTDAACCAVINGTDSYSLLEFARALERELDAATLELAHRAGAIDYAAKLRDELDKVKREHYAARDGVMALGRKCTMLEKARDDNAELWRDAVKEREEARACLREVCKLFMGCATSEQVTRWRSAAGIAQ